MHGKHIILLTVGLFLIAHAYSAIIPDPPGFESLHTYTGCTPSDDYTADPNDCTKFYRCDNNGLQFVFRCGPGTAFDPYLKTCNYRNSVPNCFNNQHRPQPPIRPPIDDICGRISQQEKIIFCASITFIQQYPGCCQVYGK